MTAPGRLFWAGAAIRGAVGLGALARDWRRDGVLPAVDAAPERVKALRAMLELVPVHGWTGRALREAAGGQAELLFPDGAAEMIELHSALADRALLEAGPVLDETRISRRVRALVLLRLDQAAQDRDAVRRGLSLLLLPGNRATALRCLARTADAIWTAAGDTSDGVSRHSKRAILAGIYGATLLQWLRNGDAERTAAFLDRRLADVAGLGRLRARLAGARR